MANTETHFGVEIKDPYRWLEDEDAPEVKTWVQQHAERATRLLSSLPQREAMASRLAELLYVETMSAPTKWGGRYFFSRKPADQEKSIHYWKSGLMEPAQVLLDPNRMSEDGSLSIKGVQPSKDGRLVAYQEHPNAADAGILRILDIDSGKLLERDTIENIRYTGVSWTPDSSGFYYTWWPSDPKIPVAERPAYAELKFHLLGTDPKSDPTVFPATGDASTFIGGALSHDGRFLFVSVSHGWSKNDLYLQRLSKPGRAGEAATSEAQAQLFEAVAVQQSARYSIHSLGERLFIRTNEGAPNFRVFELSPNQLARSAWREVISESDNAVLEEMSIVGGRLSLRYLDNAYTRLEVSSLDGKQRTQVRLPTVGTASGLIGHEEDPETFLGFSSFTYPTEILRLPLPAAAQPAPAELTPESWHQVTVPANPKEFEVGQRWATSKDGTRVPYFIMHRRGLELDGNNPTLLYGYGGFNIALEPHFSASIFPWLEAGGVYVKANLRGGGEFGESWHQAGMLHNKQNVFDDFIAVAEDLIRSKVTQPKHLGIAGRSNGGLLVGAAMTQRPDLFEAVLCGVPLLDMLRYDRFGLGKAWVPEYGDPAEEKDFRNLLAYSPLHRVQQGIRYPALLMLSADTDDRVDPLHARKFIAAIQQASTRESPRAILRVEVNAGHGGGDMREKFIQRAADEYAFLLELLAKTRTE